MSRSDNAAGDPTGYDRLIREAKEEAFHARRKLRRELPNPSAAVRLDVVAATADYYDALADYRDERAIDGDWGDHIDLDPNRLLEETAEIERSVSSPNPNASRSADVPLGATVGPERLLALGKQLDAVAKDLGFAAAAKDTTPNEEATLNDLRGLLKARGQTRALDNLPEGAATEIETPYSNDDTEVDTDER